MYPEDPKAVIHSQATSSVTYENQHYLHQQQELGCVESAMLHTQVSMLLITIGVAFAGCNRTQTGKTTAPPTIIFSSSDDRTLTMEDLRGETGTFQYEIIGSKDIPAEAQSLHQKARSAGGKGDSAAAVRTAGASVRVGSDWGNRHPRVASRRIRLSRRTVVVTSPVRCHQR